MEYSTFLDLNSLSEEARNELESFYEYLLFKYKKRKKKKEKTLSSGAKFTAVQIDTKGFKFDREEANER